MQKHKSVISEAKQHLELDDKILMNLTLSNKKINKEDVNQHFQDVLPVDLIKYRYIMHPVRLTMMKLLFLEDKMSSTEIKHLLNISWGVYTSHIESLKNKGFVETEDIFGDDGGIVTIVILTALGQTEYEDVVKLLRDFIDHDSAYNVLLSGNERELFTDNLYPNDT